MALIGGPPRPARKRLRHEKIRPVDRGDRDSSLTLRLDSSAGSDGGQSHGRGVHGRSEVKLLMPNSSDDARWYLAAVCLFQNEAHNLDEWLAFCVLEGIEHLLLYDNFSTDNFRAVLKPWIGAGFVELVDWRILFDDDAQTKAYSDALCRLRGRARWAAFIDIDEFLFSPTGHPVSEVLQQYEGHAGVIVNWQCYGTSGHTTRPIGLTIENYTRRAKTDWVRNRRVKTIVDPWLAVEPQGPHLFTVQPGEALVTENKIPVRIVPAAKWRRGLRPMAAIAPHLPIDPYSINEPSTTRVSISTLRINHYVTRSQEDLLFKYKDRNKMLERDRQSYSRYHDRNEVEDPILAWKEGRVREIIECVRETSSLASCWPLSRRSGAPALRSPESDEAVAAGA